MGQIATMDRIQAHIQGDVTGQVAIGDFNVQIGSSPGAVVNINTTGQRPTARPRPQPVALRPRNFSGLIGREAELGTARYALQATVPMEFYGEPGYGKTALLRHLAYALPPLPGGVVFLRQDAQLLDDLLQSLYDAFYEYDVPTKPTPTQRALALQNIRALVLIDDLDLRREDIEALLNAAPGCAFVLAARQHRLMGEGRVVPLRGLPDPAALALLEQGLERPLRAEEQAVAQALCAQVECRPLAILRAADLARDLQYPLADIVRRLPPSDAAWEALPLSLSELDEAERKVLAVLAVLDGAPVHIEHVAALTGLPDVAATLAKLLRWHLVQAHSPTYSLTGDLAHSLHETWDLLPWAERTFAYFTQWAEARRRDVARLADEASPLWRMLTWGATAGRWADVLRLARAFEGALALRGRWSRWAQVIELARQAALALGDQAALAWTLHQIGSRALCLGDGATAQTSLTQALHMREALGDQLGAAVTRHNIGLLPLPPPPGHGGSGRPPGNPPGPPPAAPRGLPFPWIVGGFSILLLVILALSLLWPRGPDPLAATPTASVVAVTDTPAVPPTDTAVPPTSTAVVPTETAVVPTDTAVVPTDTAVPPTWTPTWTPTRMPTNTPILCPPSTIVIPQAARGSGQQLQGYLVTASSPSTCGGRQQGCPTFVPDNTNSYSYNIYNFFTTVAQCITVKIVFPICLRLTSYQPAGNLIWSAVYQDSFDPNNCGNYLASDAGTGEYRFDVKAQMHFVIIVREPPCGGSIVEVKASGCITQDNRRCSNCNTAATPGPPILSP